VISVADRSQWPRGLRPLTSWHCGFESHKVYGCLCLSECCVLSGKGLYEGRITHSEESCRLWFVLSVIEEPHRGGLGRQELSNHWKEISLLVKWLNVCENYARVNPYTQYEITGNFRMRSYDWWVFLLCLLLNAKVYYIPLCKLAVIPWFLRCWLFTFSLFSRSITTCLRYLDSNILVTWSHFSQSLLCRNINFHWKSKQKIINTASLSRFYVYRTQEVTCFEFYMGHVPCINQTGLSIDTNNIFNVQYHSTMDSNYCQWWNGSDTFVNVFLFIPFWRWSHKWPKHGWRYLVIKLIKKIPCY
jgi:hypothetical protein